jgi:hypothetical protein
MLLNRWPGFVHFAVGRACADSWRLALPSSMHHSLLRPAISGKLSGRCLRSSPSQLVQHLCVNKPPPDGAHVV